MPSSEETRKLIDTDPDFVNLKRFDYSLEKVLEKFPDGAPTRIIAQALMITEDEVEDEYERIIAKLRTAMKVEPE